MSSWLKNFGILGKYMYDQSNRAEKSALTAAYQQQAAANAAEAKLAPYAQLGQDATSQLTKMIGGQYDVTQNPQYKGLLQSGTDAITAAGSAAGQLGSGKLGTALTGYGADLANQLYQQQFSNLYNLAGLGSGVATTQGDILQSGTSAAQQGIMNAKSNKNAMINDLLSQGMKMAGTALPYML